MRISELARRLGGAWLSAGLVAACATPGPEDTLRAYRQALQDGDAAAIHRLSDARFRADFDAEAVRVRLAQVRTATLAARLGEVTDVRRWAEVTGSDGQTVRLVEEGGAWRVAAGGLSMARYDTPEAALVTLWTAAEAGRWSDVRGALPEAYQGRFSTDEALAAHLAVARPRLEAARRALEPLSAGRAQIRGASATLRYGEGRAVRFVLEEERWRVLDVE